MTEIDPVRSPEAKPPGPAMQPMVKLLLEMGPLVLFFIANSRFGILTATAVLMVAVVLSLAVSYALTRRVPVMPLVTAVAVTLFGGLTLYFQDSMFIKLKPTIINCIFGAILLGSLAMGKLILPVVLDSVFNIDAAGWRKLTLRWGLFFFFLAGLNEVVWRTQSEDFWVNFKVFGTMPITLIFAMLQVRLIMRHEVKS